MTRGQEQARAGSLCLYFAQRVDTTAARSNQWPHFRTITAHNSWAAASPMHAVQSLQPLLLVARSGSCSAKPRDGHEPNDGPRQQRVANGATQPPAPLGTTLVAARGSRGDGRGSGGLSLGEGWRVRVVREGIVVAGALDVSGPQIPPVSSTFNSFLPPSTYRPLAQNTPYSVITMTCPLRCFHHRCQLTGTFMCHHADNTYKLALLSTSLCSSHLTASQSLSHEPLQQCLS